MSNSRTLIISSALVGAISLMLRSVLNFSVTRAPFFLATLKPFFIINGIIFALAAASFFGNGSDSPAPEHHYDDDTHRYEHDHHDHDHDHDRSSNNSSNSSSDQYNKKVHEEVKFPVRSESVGSYGVSSPEVRFPSTAPMKPVGILRPPTAPVKTFPKDDTSSDEIETMEEMWKRVKAQKQPMKPNTWQGQFIPRKDAKMSTSSWPSPSTSRARKKPPPSPARAEGKKLIMERIPSWVRLKNELSMGREELNSRVEAFITKFKDEMKLQRLESLRRPKLFRRRSDENQ